ncbi:dihydroneopterin aldolase [Faunimonas pinastri]|uniref:dihydroneopterin aldolase n=1 Tax=Faunimonas pinastri TaxID=1855383 RepID=A0A1H9JDM1_9HYPH|nr:dihydroneopterin aldolase [Faunimonas pinastri]SEQ84926.1 dihydroneopterin aldolase [Faunimonas pinastri]
MTTRDRIFVRDFVLPAEIGIYGHEFGRTQKVRFNVTVELAGSTRGARDLTTVMSYDIVTDAIRAILARGHIQFVEMLAEEIADAVLADERAACVHVRVEKLEIIDGGVGVEIVRERRAPGG